MNESFLVLIAFGSAFLINGLVIIKNKKYTQEEGMQFGSTFKGKFAIVFGFFMVAMGIALILAGLTFVLIKSQR